MQEQWVFLAYWDGEFHPSVHGPYPSESVCIEEADWMKENWHCNLLFYEVRTIKPINKEEEEKDMLDFMTELEELYGEEE